MPPYGARSLSPIACNERSTLRREALGASASYWKEKRGGPVEHYVLATLPKTMSCKQLVGRIKQRWRTERVYEDLKGELGLDHFEGRTYTGWQHHVSCVLSCYAFLVAERARAFPPEAGRTRRNDPVQDAA